MSSSKSPDPSLSSHSVSKSDSLFYPGMIIDQRYRLDRQIGEGGQGTVYWGQHIEMQRDVVIKVLKPHLCESEEQVLRFRREAQMASQLSHPNTVVTHDFGVFNGIPYIAMEALRGECLADYLYRVKTLPLPLLLHIIREVGLSLTEAHHKGMVHRDLKPENIFLVFDSVDPGLTPKVKVLDFGIAKLISSHPEAQDSQLTVGNTIFGTPQYMAPEQIRGLDLDQRVDIYALGIILYQCCLGEPPFQSENVIDTLTQHLTLKVPQVQTKAWKAFELHPEYLKAFNYLLSNTLAKNPADRFETSEKLVEEVDAVLNDFQKPPQKRKISFKFKPSKTMVIGTFIVLIALIGFLLFQSIKFTKTTLFMDIHSLLEEPLNEEEIATTRSKKSKGKIGLLKIKSPPGMKKTIEVWLNGKLKNTLDPISINQDSAVKNRGKGKKKKGYIQFRVKAGKPHEITCKASSLKTETITLTVKPRHRTTYTCFAQSQP